MMSRALVAPRLDAVPIAVVVVVTAGVFAMVAGHGMQRTSARPVELFA